jgi:hypothetical protein
VILSASGEIATFVDVSQFEAGRSAYCGLAYLGLPKSNEISIDGLPGVVKQEFERGWAVYDPQRAFDNPPGAGNVYLMHLP